MSYSRPLFLLNITLVIGGFFFQIAIIELRIFSLELVFTELILNWI
jgi:hypothetical protein